MSFTKLENASILKYCDYDVPVTLYIIESGFVHEPRYIVVMDSPHGNDTEIMSKEQIDQTYGIKF